MPLVEIKDFNALIDNKPFFDQPVKNKQAYEKLTEMSRNDNYITGDLLNYLYHQNYYKLVAIDLSRQTNTSIPQQISPPSNSLEKEFHEFLPPLNINSFFWSPNDKNEIISIVSALDSQKASRSNSIPIKILKLMKNDISDQLAVLFNLSFSCGSFPTFLKTSKVTPIYKKDSKT